jgi:hypothetical protein
MRTRNTGPHLPRPWDSKEERGWGPASRSVPRRLNRGHGACEAEREGFEPSIEREPDTRLAGECLQPLGHLSARMSDCMPRLALISAALVVVLLVGCQLLLPELAERQVEKRLEADGGSAEVSLRSFPAPRLLFGDGDAFEVVGRGVTIDLDRRERVLERLDGFDEVHVRLADLRAGPLQVGLFQLDRDEGRDAYDVLVDGKASPRDVASFLGSSAGGALGGLLGDLAAGSLPGDGEASVPLEVKARVVSVDGEVKVTSSSGSVGGVPAGPLAELVVEVVVRQL